jgi:outer membrane protein with beta-barrel domain
MRHQLPFILLTFAIVFAAKPAAAQRRVPDAGMWAVGGSIGATVPKDASLQNGLEVAGNLEGYLTPRVSIRGQIGATWWDITGRNFTGTVKPVFFDGNIVYNWEGGVWHPYVTAGVGAYRFKSSINPNVEGSDTKAGFDVGGGIEYFFTRDATITGELLYHKVDSFNSPVTTFNDGSFWSFSVGAKKYF